MAGRPPGRWCERLLLRQLRVEQNMRSTGYPTERVHLVKGLVEDTIPAHAPARIALLRLDTDWYASTKHELEHLWPRLSVGGVIILDDYGCWRGARKATDEYFAAHGIKLFLERHGIPEARSAIKR
jgi:O-methyltransferase